MILSYYLANFRPHSNSIGFKSVAGCGKVSRCGSQLKVLIILTKWIKSSLTVSFNIDVVSHLTRYCV